jgi:hypothetical protein
MLSSYLHITQVIINLYGGSKNIGTAIKYPPMYQVATPELQSGRSTHHKCLFTLLQVGPSSLNHYRMVLQQWDKYKNRDKNL